MLLADRGYDSQAHRQALRTLGIRPLIARRGANPLVAIEPDPALAAYLEKSLGDRIGLHIAPLEDAQLSAETFDLAVAASSFHWVDEKLGLAKILAALRPGGWWAMWWTLFGDGDRPDAFITATSPLLQELHASPTAGEDGRPPYARDSDARLAALTAAGFEEAEHDLIRWRTSWDTHGICALYGTFSPIARLDEKRKATILDGVARIAEDEFAGRVERTLLTSIYTARRPVSREQ